MRIRVCNQSNGNALTGVSFPSSFHSAWSLSSRFRLRLDFFCTNCKACHSLNSLNRRRSGGRSSVGVIECLYSERARFRLPNALANFCCSRADDVLWYLWERSIRTKGFWECCTANLLTCAATKSAGKTYFERIPSSAKIASTFDLK